MFPYGVILTPGMCTRLLIDNYRVLTPKKFFDKGRPKTYTAKVEKYYHAELNDVKCVIFPRYCLASLVRDLGIVPRFVLEPRLRTHFDKEPLTHETYKLYDYQECIVDTVCADYLNKERQDQCRASCLIKLDTGLGKSFIAAEIIRRMRLRTVIIVPQIELARQFEADLNSVFTNLNIVRGVDVFCDISIIVIDTAVTFDKALYTQFGLVIFDEVPAYCTDTRRSIFYLAKQFCAIGMSATPTRADGLHVLLRDHLMGVVDQAQFDCIQNDFKVEYAVHRYTTPDSHVAPAKNNSSGTMMFMSSCRDCLSYDADRNRFIAEISYDLYKRGRPHYIFTIIADHARFLAEFIDAYIASREKDKEHKPTISTLAGSDPVYGLRESSIIVSTYAKGSVGISVNTMTAAIWAMVPFETRYTQLIGRITRKNVRDPGADKITREIHIVRDSAFWLRPHFERIAERLHIDDLSKNVGPKSTTSYETSAPDDISKLGAPTKKM